MSSGPPGAPPGGMASGSTVAHWLKTPGRVVLAVFDDLVTTFYPSDCRTCGGPLVRAGFSPVCDLCIRSISPQSMTLCRCCGEALDMESVRFAGQYPSEGLLCAPCRRTPPEFERAVAHAVYEDELREMVHLLKYERMRSMARPLGKLLARAMETLAADAGPELLVVAVPLYPAKQRQRGYNQAVLLADAALRELRKAKPEWRLRAAHRVIRRVKDTRSQFELTPSGRRRNLRGAFTVPEPAMVAGREVLLVDDIYTTGATARACAQVLRLAGASRVWVATVSRAQPQMVASWDASSETAVWDAG